MRRAVRHASQPRLLDADRTCRNLVLAIRWHGQFPSTGTVDPLGRAVKGAVDEFAARRCLEVKHTINQWEWNSWIIRKPATNVPEPGGADIDVPAGGEYRPGAKPPDAVCDTRIERV